MAQKPQLRTVLPSGAGQAAYGHIHAGCQVVPLWEGLRGEEPQQPQGYEVGYPAQPIAGFLAGGDLTRDGEG